MANNAAHIVPPRWPFDIRRLPFYHGWVIWLFSTAGVIFSIPGQTMGMAAFTDHLIKALGLSRTQLSRAYLIGTVGSSIFLTSAGRGYDGPGGRVMVSLASALLALMLEFIAATDSLAARFGGGVLVSFALITVGYFGVRFFGQGVLTSASRKVLLIWFEKRRGLVSSGSGTFVTFGFAVAPLVLAWMIANGGWREALWELAVCCLGFAVIALLTLRDNPGSCGHPLLVAGFGVGGGLWTVTSNLAFIGNFGPLHLGEITGLCTSIMVFASAMGPALFSLGLDLSGSYAAAQWLCIALPVGLLVFALVVPQDSPGKQFAA